MIMQISGHCDSVPLVNPQQIRDLLLFLLLSPPESWGEERGRGEGLETVPEKSLSNQMQLL